jgi:membrane protein
MVGGVAASAVFEIARQLMTSFVTFFPTYQLVYGVFSAVPLFLIWIYVSWSILLVGAELAQALSSYRLRVRLNVSTLGVALSILQLLHNCHRRGEMLDEADLLQQVPGLTSESWEQYYQLLNRARLVALNAQGEVLLSRDLRLYSFADLYCLLHPKAFEIEMQAEAIWQQRVLTLFDQGVVHLRQHWNIPLASLFEEAEP